MSTFTGTNGNDEIRPGFISSGVTTDNEQYPDGSSDIIYAKGGNDIVEGGGGIDQAYLGSGNDRYTWNLGDGNDIIDGGVGVDTLKMFGVTGEAATYVFSADGNHLSALCSTDNEKLDVANVEHVYFRPLVDQDTVTVQDLSGTGVTRLTIDLSATSAGTTPDGDFDKIEIQGRNPAADHIVVSSVGATINVQTAGARVSILDADYHNPVSDRLTIKGFGGNDRIDASHLKAGLIDLSLDGGIGNDHVTGSKGDDHIEGGDGRDVLKGGKGYDSLYGNEGADRLIGGGGNDNFNFLDKLDGTVDRIVDFKPGADKIILADIVFGQLGGSLDIGEFHVGSQAADSNDMIIYDPDTGALYYDHTGNAVAGDAVHFATLAKHLSLTYEDFSVILT